MSETIQPDTNAAPPTTTATEGVMQSTLRKLSESSHPVALICYLFFQISPLAIYIFGLFFTANYILFFIVVILLLAADFWNTKNISGRLLVGLRWWNETNDLGQSVLVFETADPSRQINPIDSKMFWLFIYICPASWIIFGIIAILKLELLSLVLVAIGIALTSTNTMAYTKCDKFGKANSIANEMLGSTVSGMMDRFNPFKSFFSR